MTENGNNWLGSWFSAARNKSSEVLEFVKKDLGEFGSAVKNEATSVVSSTGSMLERTLKLDEPESTASTMKRSISSFLGQMNEVLNPSPDDSDTEAILIVENSDPVTLTKLQQSVYKLQKDEKTFLNDPELALKKQYECWLEIIDDQLSEDRIAKHLASSETLKTQYSTLVPNLVSHTLFWKRYLFKKALVEDEIAREEAMERREAKEKQITEESLKWDQEDFANDIELTEEEQIRILEDYEKETRQKQTSPIREKKLPKQKPAEKIILQKTSPAKKKGSGEVSDSMEFIEAEREDKKLSELQVNENESIISVGTSCSNSSTDDDWEKINDTEK